MNEPSSPSSSPESTLRRFLPRVDFPNRSFITHDWSVRLTILLPFDFMAKIFIVISIVISCCLPAIAQVSLPVPVRIGLILPLTGAHAQTAAAMRNAATLSYDDLAQDTQRKIELVFEDDQLDAAKAISAFNKLVSVDKVQAVVTFGGQSVAAIAPLAARSGVAIIALTADSSLVRGRPFVFQHWLSSEEQANAIFKVFDKAPVKKVALVSTTHNAALDILSEFEQHALKKGMEVVYKQDFLPTNQDFRMDILRLKLAKPDAILGVLVLPHMGLFAKQLRAAGVQTPMYCSANAEAEDEVLSSQGAMEGVIYAGADLSDDFVAHFESRFGKYPEFAAPHVYDAVKLFAQAIDSGAKNGSDINANLLSYPTFQGAMGVYELVDGYRYAVRAVPKQIKDGKFQKLMGYN